MAKASPGEVRYTKVTVDTLHFDPSNPRFSGPDGNKKTDDEIQALLEREPHIALELVDSFLENGFIEYEPLVVKTRTDGDYFVVEGNRRLAAIRHIRQNRSKYEKKSSKLDDLEQVSVLIFPDGDREQQKKQRVYLGVRHLFGFREWPAESKARFLDSQVKTKVDVARTMRELNIKKHELLRYLIPYRIRKLAADLIRPHQDQDFWVLGEGLNRAGVKEYIRLEFDKDTLEVKRVDQKRLRNLLTFVYGTPQKNRQDRLIAETRELSKLGKVLSNQLATAAVEKGRSLEDALVLLDSPAETIRRLARLTSQMKAVVALLKGRKDAKLLADSFGAFETAAKKFIRNAQ